MRSVVERIGSAVERLAKDNEEVSFVMYNIHALEKTEHTRGEGLGYIWREESIERW